MDRINWYPVPAMIAIALYLLEEPVRVSGTPFKYLARPALWAVSGLGAAILGAFAILRITGADASVSTSSFSSSLLWYRLLPNPTFSFGILPAIVCISLPAWLLIGWRMRKSTWHPIRIFGLFAILFVLFAGGLVSSTKIGGGSDLHNLDAYLVMLVIVTGYFYSDKFPADTQTGPRSLPWQVAALVVLLPVFFALQSTQLEFPKNIQKAEQEIKQLNSLIASSSKNGEVLFISQRQLLTFGAVKGVKLVPDYEIVTLMEMVMSGNQGYLGRFKQDISRHRFSLIIIEPQRVRIEPPGHAFNEENNVWVNTITTPLLCNYQPVLALPIANVDVYQPRLDSTNCP